MNVRLLVALLLVLLAGGAPAQEKKPLRLAMSGAFQPFSTTDAEGNLVGFDADIATALARRMGRRPVLVQVDWTGIQAGLQSGKFDLICGSMAITPERLKTMNFSLPYYVSGAQVFGPKGVTPKRLGLTEDSTYAHYVEEHPKLFPGVKIVHFGSEAEIVAAMNADKVDGFISDRIVGGFYLSKNGQPGMGPQGELLYREACGIAARQSEPKLLHEVNQALLGLVQSGEYAAIYKKWVGSPPDLEILLGSWGEFSAHIPAVGSTGVGAEDKPEFADETSSMFALLAKGAWLTIQLSLLTAFLALLTGALLGVATVSKNPLARYLSLGYIALIRGTPLLVQLFISYFVFATAVNRAIGSEFIGPFGAALVALVLNTTAYNAETLRGGIQAVDKGQWDAAASLGMRRSQTLQRIILPQAFRDSLPSLGNNLVVLIKDTSLVGAITLIELTYAARNVVFQTGQAFLPFFMAGGFYLVIISLVSLGMTRWEKHLNRSRGGS